jgi:hypothetical protein
MLVLIALALLGIGGVLEVAGVAFWGLDLLIGFSFAGSVILAGTSALCGRHVALGLALAGAAAFALGLHLCVNLGILG